MDFLDDLHRAELEPIIWLQQWPDWVRPVLELVSVFGTDTFFLLCLPLLYWCVDPRLALRLALTVMVSAAVNSIAKLALHQPRPYWIDARVRPLSVEGAFGLPSGHAQNGTAGLGRLAVTVARPWVWWTAGGLTGLVCLSRVYLGVHFVTDVVTGVLLGAAVLMLVLKLERPLTAWWRGLTLWAQLAASAVLSGALIGAAGLANAPYAGWSLPAGWSSAGQVAPESLTTIVTMAGVLFGTLAGASIMHRAGWFDAGGPLGLRAARWLLGTAVAALIWYVQRDLLPQTDVVTYAGYAALALWVQLGAPVTFIRLGLMSRARQAQPVH
ncbi:phosphatase PAP2 family protein [Nonomuraea turkmeniaca]|uniref:Phosphatase PAP2 family protein n=1 Tax=Nonomuraea turkmeniaca TaxID=103838 RepID=A0A5S4G3U1_9ACTN|nr:phosphatase PAP2 family protein [Nonomuraea turkmeniaca]TMR20700.1 phosphatase PAP2 family protein [Nonomuraea turkmeniaca]